MATPAPPPPIITYQTTPDISIGQAIAKLTEKNSTIEMLGNIESDNDVQRLALMISLGSDIDLQIPFCKNYAYTELALTNSLRTKSGGIRSEHLVKITKAPDMMQPQEGIISRLKNKLGR